MSGNVIDIKNMSFSFGDHLILDDVSLNIKEKEMVGIVGPNGGGKTTLLRLMLGLLQPNKGFIEILGSNALQARKRIGYVPQHKIFDPLFPVSVLDVVLMGRISKSKAGPFSKNDRHAALRALDDVDLRDQQNAAFADLSGGQRQRTLIARALASSAELLFFDEPTANVDSFAEGKLYELLSILNKQLTILIVSHDVGFVSKYVSSVVCVNRKVHIHPTSLLDGRAIQEIYQKELAFIHHDHRCSEKGHTWVNL